MGRRSLADERRPQILHAARRVIAAHGLGYATQERIAQEAGLTRPHIRHYVGNRREVVELVWVQTMQRYFESLEITTVRVTESESIEPLLEFFFGPGFSRDEDDQVIEAYFSEAQHDADLRARLGVTYARLTEIVSEMLGTCFPGSAPESLARTAHGIMCLAMGNSSMSVLHIPGTDATWARQSAEALIAAALTPRLA